METAAGIRRRIELAEELLSVTGTMKSLAAVSIHQYEHSVYAVEAYLRGVERGLQILLRYRPQLAREPTWAMEKATMVLVLGSARGLCGPLNRHVAGEARSFVDLLLTLAGDEPAPAAGPARPATAVAACGTRVATELEAIGLAPGTVVPAPATAEAIGDRVEELLAVIDRWRSEVGPGRVFLVHPRPRSAHRAYEPAVVPLLPLDAARLGRLADDPWPTRVLPLWRGDWRQVFAALTHQLLFAGLHRALAETQVCVHRARLAAMQAAEDGIGQRLDELSVHFHRLRQAAVTSELLDVVSGFEAATGSPARSRGPA